MKKTKRKRYIIMTMILVIPTGILPICGIKEIGAAIGAWFIVYIMILCTVKTENPAEEKKEKIDEEFVEEKEDLRDIINIGASQIFFYIKNKQKNINYSIPPDLSSACRGI